MSLTWRKHPILTPPTPEEMVGMGPEKLAELWELYHQSIENAERDPYRYGWEFKHWRDADEYFSKYRTLMLLGANRSAKTSYGAKRTVRAAIENPESLIYCFSQKQETSVVVQQAAVWNFMPAEYKNRRTGQTEYISYSIQNGFAGNSIVFPNKSRILFKTYSQWQQDQSILEGMELGSRDPQWINIGAWLDEYLLGMDLLDRLYLRLASRDAKMLITFTPKDGITETVRYYTHEAKTEATRHGELLRMIHKRDDCRVPSIQTNDKKNTAIIYFHSKDNPWSGYETIVEQCRAKNDLSYTLTAAYGVPTKSYAGRFPLFSREINVVKHEDIPRKDVTRYMVLDPAGSKNWAMLWIAVDATGTYWVYREWPDVNVGDWAKWHGGKMIGGDGSKGLGYGIKDYVQLITQLEEGEEIFERLIDPRLGAAKYQTQNGASSIIEELADAGLTFIPAPGLDIEDGIQAIQTKMAYNVKLPIDGLNRPHLYVSDRCENLLLCLQEYTGEGGGEEATKDFVDCLRYAAIDGIRYIEPTKVRNQRRSGY